jgi:NAD(P)-dependent dehydrogenase (short-subunit alcohol dehydrogenase family)
MAVTADSPPTSSRVIVTGAASGIGAASAGALRARGARVVGLDIAAGPDVLACDVRDQRAVDAAVAEAVERLGGLDAVVNCAGIGDPQSAGRPPAEDALRVLDVNLLGPWRVTAAALPALRSSRGRVVNVASGLAHLTVPFATAYCMSKRALVGYSDALRLEHGDEITVTSVYPGYIRTAIHRSAEALGISLEGLVPAERVEDAAGTIVRAVLGPPARDLATTRRGAAGYALLRLAPRGLVDRAITRRMRQAIARGNFDGSELAGDLCERIAARRAAPTREAA